MSKAKLGSLFSGIGGFEYVASLYDIEPSWASEIEEPCIRITKQHFPNMVHLGDIMQIHGDKIEPVDIISGGSPCFPAGTMVLTTQGYVNIEDIKVGDVVLTHMGRWRPVTAVGHRESETIILKGNSTIETTKNHPIYSADIKHIYPRKPNGKRGNEKQLINVGEWTAAELMEHKQWATPMVAESLEVPNEEHTMCNQKDLPEMGDDFWYFVGRWLGDGWVRTGPRADKPNGEGHGCVFLCDSISKEDELISTVKPISNRYTVVRERTVVKIRFCSQLLCKWLTHNFGKGAINKRIPGFVFGLSESHRKALLRGVLESDGYSKREGTYRVSSISKALVLGIRMLGESLGYATSTSYYKRKPTCVIEGRVVNQHDTYSVDLTSNKNRKTGMPYMGHKWYPCRSVIPTNQVKTVYNISVEEDESYIADSIVVHNCTNLSCAGTQKGISLECPDCGTLVPAEQRIKTCPKCGGELEYVQSGLFIEQIRVIKEMRESTNGKYPKFVIFENVSGALSSNNGEDFKCVLNEFCGLFGEELPALRPEKWPKSGEILGDTGSLAWRTFDAQYWGVPQRRRRIYLVVDLTGQRAGEILFKPESLRRHTSEGKGPWKRASGKAKESIGKSDEVMCVATQQVNAEICTDIAPTLTAANGTSGSNKPYIVEPRCGAFLGKQGETARSIGYSEIASPTLTAGEPPQVAVYGSDAEVYGLCSLASNSMKSDNPNSGFYRADVSKTLDTTGLNPMCNQGGNVVVEQPVYCIQGNCIDRADTAGCNGKGWTQDVCYTLTTIDRPAVAYAVHENQRNELRLSEETAYALTTGGGKPSQGAPVVLTEESEVHSAGFAYQAGAKNPSIGYGEEVSPTLLSKQQMAVLVENHPNDSRVKLSEDNICQTLSARMGTGGGNVPLIMETEKPLTTTTGDYMQFGEDLASTLMARDYKDPQCVLVNSSDDTPCVTDASHTTVGIGVSPTITARDYKDPHITMAPKSSIVRRLTPTECEKLQGFESGWTATESDSARYKALGNSVALPCVDYVMSGIADLLYPETDGDA